jgi:hypothetical protein
MSSAMRATFFVAAMITPAYAQLPTRTYVSSTGNDASDCSRASPCRTFSTAMAKTAASGQVDAIDGADFGSATIPLVINKAITIDGHGFAAISAAAGRAFAVVISAADDDAIILRGLQINGMGTVEEGVELQNAKQLLIQNCKVFGFTDSGILVSPATRSGRQSLVVTNSTITNNIKTSGFSAGIRTRGGITTVSHSVIAQNGLGLMAERPGIINADSNVLTGNTIAVYSSSLGPSPLTPSIIRLSNNDVYGNLTGFGCGGGEIASNGTNRKGNNTGGGSASCTPTTTITQQ